jgi:hypothetical protein
MIPALVAAGVLALILFIPFTRHLFLHILGHLLHHTVGHFWEKHEDGFEVFLIVGSWVLVAGAGIGIGVLAYLAVSYFHPLL